MSTNVLLDVASAARLFQTPDGTAFADLVIEGHRVCIRNARPRHGLSS